MDRKRDVRGRYERSEEVKAVEEAGGQEQRTEALVGAPRPRYCRSYTRARFAEALPEVAATLVREAKKGSVAHLKLLVQMSGLDKGEVSPERAKRRVKNLEEILMEAWDKEVAAERSADVAERFPDTSGGE